MRLNTLSDYLTFTYRLGLWTETYAKAHEQLGLGSIDPIELDIYGFDLDKLDPEQRELYDEYREVLNSLADWMTLLNLPKTRAYLVSFLEQVGDLRSGDTHEFIMSTLADEIYENQALQEESMVSLPLDLWHDPARLRSDIMSLMPAGTYAYLPDIAQQDLVDAGQCLAHHQATPAATMLLRCVEAMLREFYTSVTGETGDGVEWSAMERGIDKAIANDGMYIISPLRDLRINYRNKTMHPERRYNLEEAQRLFHLCIEALTRMAEYLDKQNRPKGIA